MDPATRQLVEGVMRTFGVPIPNPRQWIPHSPTPRQELFLALQELEAFYGGAAGGGKSDALLMGALQYVDIPGYAAIIFRRTLQDLKLPEALMARAHEWLDRTPAKWVASDMQWRFPSGAILQFGYLDSEDDKLRYQSSAYQFIAFDELTHFTQSQYRFLFSRLRKLEGANVPLRMRSASNPGGRGALWVKNHFIPDGFVPAHAEAIRVWVKPITYEADEMLMLKDLFVGESLPVNRAFVPARMQDNPHLDQASYISSLYQLDRVTREQMLKGDWSIQVIGRQRFYGPMIEQFTAKPGVTGELRLKKDEFGTETPMFFPLDRGALEVWEPPQRGRVYAAGADTAEGIEMSEDPEAKSDPDYSVCEISDAMSGEQVARLRYRMSEAVFGEDLYTLLRWYNSPFFVPEVKGGYGRATLNKLLDLGYPQTLIFNKHLMDELQGLPPYRGDVSYHDLGWNTMPANRELLISLLDDAILKHKIEEYDSVGIEELRHFCYDARGKAKAESGYHDDTVIAKCLREVARIFAKKLAPMRARQDAQAASLSKTPRKYGQQPRRDVEEEQWWKSQQRRR
jgi:hypothetical protein